jgi:DNA-binding MarR family transcriptional regulator
MTAEHVAGEPVAADRTGLGHLIGYAARLLWRTLAERLEGLGLDADSYIVLVNVAISQERSGRGPLVSEMAGQLALDHGAFERAIEHLRQARLITVAREPSSERIALTPKAVSLMPVLQNEARWVLENALSGFTYEEIDGFGDHLRRVIANLGGRAG